jgi:GTPase SAR1 family protein
MEWQWILFVMGIWKPKVNILMIGPENSGKTSFKYFLHQEQSIYPFRRQGGTAVLDEFSSFIEFLQMIDVKYLSKRLF